MVENWKEIPGYEGYYEVSDLGGVRSMDRVSTAKDGKAYHRKGKLLNVNYDRGGRPQVFLSKNGKVKNHTLYRLVMLSFVGQCPEDQEVCHNDGDTTNSALTNLRYGTKSQNAIDVYRQGKTSGKGKITIKDVVNIRQFHQNNEKTQKELAKMYEVTISCISKIITRRTFSWLNDDGKIEKGA